MITILIYQRRSTTSKTAIIGNSQIPSTLGQTITGALANIPFPFGIDSQGNYGYKKAGADTVIPFSSDFASYFEHLHFATVAVPGDGTVSTTLSDVSDCKFLMSFTDLGVYTDYVIYGMIYFNKEFVWGGMLSNNRTGSSYDWITFTNSNTITIVGWSSYTTYWHLYYC